MSEKILEDSKSIKRMSNSDPGTAGDRAEESWAELLRKWIPVGYRVETKGIILGSDGQMSPQIDIVVLDPSYPVGLISDKLYLAPAVVAAFECKLTLRSLHIDEALKTSAILERMMRLEGRRAGEFFYGMLAHSHSWQGPKSNPIGVIESAFSAGYGYSESPAELLDFLCVADLGTWLNFPMLWGGMVETVYMGQHEDQSKIKDSPYYSDPVARMVTHVLGRMGAGKIAKYLDAIGAAGVGVGAGREWPNVKTVDIPVNIRSYSVAQNAVRSESASSEQSGLRKADG
ncbi:DUF6602 domain-containing protein [Embleya sp. NPDC005575]|uniref:DUF6602 domain-containing protein n=1 Tax=Embleya sp. NPDC005575 TaxID=3156892 RepID=UPI0033BBBB9D